MGSRVLIIFLFLFSCWCILFFIVFWVWIDFFDFCSVMGCMWVVLFLRIFWIWRNLLGCFVIYCCWCLEIVYLLLIECYDDVFFFFNLYCVFLGFFFIFFIVELLNLGVIQVGERAKHHICVFLRCCRDGIIWILFDLFFIILIFLLEGLKLLL